MDRRTFMFSTFGAALYSATHGALAHEQDLRRFGAAFRAAPDAGFPRRDLNLIAGQLPSDLQGTYFLNGPAGHERGGERYKHWFDGDGMIQAFRFGNGQATHEGRYVQTGKHKKEREAGRLLFTAFGTVPENPAPVTQPDDVNAANISVIERGDKLWALWEAGTPTAVDPDDLSTFGPVVLGEGFEGVPFSAHPRISADGTLWGYGFDSFSGRLILTEIAPDGALRRFKMLTGLPKSMVHDFITTSRHIVIGFSPFWLTRGGELAYVDRFEWKPQEARQYVVIDKENFEIVRRYETPAAFQFHHFGAYEEDDGTIRFAACAYPDASWVQTESFAVMDGTPFTGTREALFEAITLYPDGRVTVEGDNRAAEFPTGDPRLSEMAQTQFCVGRSLETNNLSNAIVARAPDGEIVGQWSTDESTLMGEHIVIPRPNGGAYLIGTQFDAQRGRTLLALLDAQYVDRGPLALWQVPTVIPMPLHGTWVGA